tara:strand:- start:230 stop:526 length:297 start_codon:yes stop_codon:yes gene_type:complete
MCAEHQGDHEDVEEAPQEGALQARPHPGIFARGGIAMVRWYQRNLSPLKPPVCRFHPSCSQYTLEAIERYGLIRGSFMGAARIMRCNPFHPGGYDPVP